MFLKPSFETQYCYSIELSYIVFTKAKSFMLPGDSYAKEEYEILQDFLVYNFRQNFS